MAIKFNMLTAPMGLPLLSSVLVLLSLGTQHAMAESDVLNKEDNVKVDEVVVVGTRKNLMNAQDIKREADTFVDAISADDIGALPDRSVLDAIKRLPGVAIERFVGPNDPDHFSVEGSGVILRGMVQTRSEFNGRDSFTANSGRGLSFQDIPPELMAGVDVYKNQTADMVEGGIGGTITLRTRKPFDSDERVLAFSSDYSYGDLAKKSSPSLSGLYSDRWSTHVGEIGFLVNYAKSTLYGTSHGIQSDAFVPYYAEDLAGAERFVNEGEGEPGLVWIPNAANLLMKEDHRKREGLALAAQFESTDETLLATAQFMRSDASLVWNERAIKYQGNYYDIDSRETEAKDGTDIAFDDQGLFQSGILVNGGDVWRAANFASDHIPRPRGGLYNQWGHKTQMDSRVNDLQTLIEDYSLNLLWTPNERFGLEGDLQFIHAKTSNDDVAVHINTWAAFDYDIRGSRPSLSLIEPWFGVRDEARDEGLDTYEAGYPGFSGDPKGDSNFFQDPNSYLWTSAMDHYERSNGESIALRLDADYHFDNLGVLKTLQAGYRYSRREQTVRFTQWNWGETLPAWQNAGLGWLPGVESQQDAYEWVDWSEFMHGGTVDIPGGSTIHATEAFIRSISGRDPSRTVETISGDSDRWLPYPARGGLDDKYGIFSPAEVNQTIEAKNAFYLRLDFAGDGELPFSGNLGLRYLVMERDATGVLVFPNLTPETTKPEELSLPIDPDAAEAYFQAQVVAGDFNSVEAAFQSSENDWVNDESNYLSAEERAFANGYGQASTAHVSSRELLPSFNIKLELTPNLISRFAIAKALAFPNMDDVRNRAIVEVAGDLVRTPKSDASTAEPVDKLLKTVGVPAWNAGGGNPYIQPMRSLQYDFSLEWYFSDVGQLSASLFHKNLSNYFVQGVTSQTFTNESTGVSNIADLTSTRNGGKGKLDGIELSYHQFFEGMFEGFGVQASYTYVDSTGIPNNEVDVDNERWFESQYEDTGIRVKLDSIPLQGQSDDTVNLVGMYELGPWNAQLGYSWRSKYLLTTRDVISKAPQWYNAHGELDGSVFFDIGEHFTIGLQATNMTNAQSEIVMILNDELIDTGRSWFISDRRIALVLRGTF